MNDLELVWGNSKKFVDEGIQVDNAILVAMYHMQDGLMIPQNSRI